MSSAESEIDLNEYIDSLPTFRPRPDNFARDLRGLLRNTTILHALAIIEEQALLAEKQFIMLPLGTPDGQLQSVELKGKIIALRSITETLINATEETTDARSNSPE